MSRNESQGVVQVTGLDLFSLNDALRQIQEKYDALKGLSGRAVVHDRVGVESATQDADAATLLQLRNLKLAEGTQAAPALTFETDPDTGLFRLGENQLGITIGGVLVMDLNTTRVLIPVQLQVTGKITASSEVEIDGALNHDGSTVGFYGTAPASQAAAGADLTGSVSGTTDGAMQSLTDPGDAPATADALRDDLVATLIPELRNNLSELHLKVNKALQVLRGVGLMAT